MNESIDGFRIFMVTSKSSPDKPAGNFYKAEMDLGSVVLSSKYTDVTKSVTEECCNCNFQITLVYFLTRKAFDFL